MAMLQSHNVFGIAQVAANHVGITMFCFTDDGMHKVARRFKILPPLEIISDPIQLPFAGDLDMDGKHDFVYSFVKEPNNPKAVIENSRVIDFIYEVADELAGQLAKKKKTTSNHPAPAL
jgi:hypothetical protein